MTEQARSVSDNMREQEEFGLDLLLEAVISYHTATLIVVCIDHHPLQAVLRICIDGTYFSLFSWVES